MSGMLRKKEVFTIITPIPGFIPRQLAIDILHSHSEVITLNPLVIDHKAIKAPQSAAADEYYSTWYEIIERIQYVPGLGRMGSGKISFNGCFHNMPWGLQTHIYAPMNVDLRNKYRIAGNQPGVEPPEHQEIGLASLGAPADGLYLREDVEIKCNITMISFVKSQLKQANKEMVSRIVKKAELLDAGVLQAMMENGKLRTINPADRSSTIKSPLPSPTQMYQPPMSPGMSPGTPYQVPRPMSVQPGQYAIPRPGTAQSHQTMGYGSPNPGYVNAYAPPPLQQQQQQQQQQQYEAPQGPQELAGSYMGTASIPSMPIEMPGDFYHASPNLQPPPSQQQSSATSSPNLSHRDSTGGAPARWSAADYPGPGQGQPMVQGSPQPNNSRPTSMSSTGSRSPGLDHKGFASDLSTHAETSEEHRADALKRLDPPPPGRTFSQYNPADYAKVQPSGGLSSLPSQQQMQQTYAGAGYPQPQYQQGQAYGYGH